VSLLQRVAQGTWWASCLPGWHRFRQALGRPAATQDQLLARLVSHHEDTAFGREHHFAKIRSMAQYRDHVPTRSWEDLTPWLERTWAGEENVITPADRRGRITLFEPSSGSTSATKWVPCTPGLLGEFQAGIAPWIFDLFRQHPSLQGGSAYWSVSPSLSEIRATDGGTPIGFDEDAAYLGGGRQALVNRVLCVPGAVKGLKDLGNFRYATLLHLLAAADLRLISVWSPTFLTVLLSDLAAHWEALLTDLEQGTLTPPAPLAQPVPSPQAAPGRAQALAESGPNNLRAVWPHLQLISCWTDAAAARHLAPIEAAFPGVAIQPKGLLATEAFVSLPFQGAHPLALTSHVLEFERDDGSVVGPGELEDGQEAAVIVSTSGGLFRYRLGDRIRVDGFVGKTPSIRFLGKVDKTSDLCGEKLHEAFVDATLSALWKAHALSPRFAMLAPCQSGDRLGYALYLEIDSVPEGLAAALEERLRQNFHYEHCVQVGQLDPVRIVAVHGDGWQAFYASCQNRGQKAGDVKPSALDLREGWSECFSGETLQIASR